MQHQIITLALLFTSFLFAQSPNESKIINGQEITVTLLNASNDEGTINFAFYNKETFMKTAPLFTKVGKISKGKSTVVFENIPSGEYAIICYHDANSNERMDFMDNGMPQEDFGTSNNPLNFGPPNYEDSKFEVKEEAISLEIKF
jgi:uncharacterized protein (DUF2141 family)